MFWGLNSPFSNNSKILTVTSFWSLPQNLTILIPPFSRISDNEELSFNFFREKYRKHYIECIPLFETFLLIRRKKKIFLDIFVQPSQIPMTTKEVFLLLWKNLPFLYEWHIPPIKYEIIWQTLLLHFLKIINPLLFFLLLLQKGLNGTVYSRMDLVKFL